MFTSGKEPDVLAKFPLDRTLDNIIRTSRVDASAPVSKGEREDLLNSLLSGFKQNTLFNPGSKLTFPIAVRSKEAALTAASLLDPSSANFMTPVGLFNRLDLAPASYANCGEYRIVYAKKSSSPTDRFFLIFEAALPNADPHGSKEGCKEVATFWNGLSGMSDQDAATKLAAFYYDGGVVDGGTVKFEPVVHYQHYGLPDGQVRANAFIPDPQAFIWHLMQWEIAPNEAGVPVFRNTPVNETPVPAFFGGTPAAALPTETYNRISGQFGNDFVNRNVWQLINTDRTALLQSSSGETLIDNLGVDIDDQYYAVESAAADSDNPAVNAANTPTIAGIARTLADAKVDRCGVTPEQVLNRMGAMTCGGCHNFSNGAEIAPGVKWPDSLGFVQINEGGQLSDLLTKHFLPARFDNVQTTITTAVLAALDGPKNIGSQRTTLHQMLDSRKQTGQGLLKDDKAADLAIIALLADQVRRASQAEPGAFTTFRKPD
ncbi:hypothetical protein FJ936_13435 [Mesorhizobium sp. B2-4-13]|uniref:hypothetical protein n=1 Tax=Mesorhizobium sp. B2-4-13 TaxID=2589936 RepID=UPI00114E478A|nr:hypothetical protein [Mesorhizobium sp. B2-4-13]TPK84875.1 hypothetical protein FJ936_13435 [Mesorhizobium sp. B2-4-13]